jgi:hypothetical protein
MEPKFFITVLIKAVPGPCPNFDASSPYFHRSGKSVPVTDPEGSRRLKFLDFKTVAT